MRTVRVAVLLLLLLSLPLPAGASDTAVISEDVTFKVTNPLDPGRTYLVRGVLLRPRGCSSSVLLAKHGISYGAWAWDFPLRPETYSMARAIDRQRGYATLAIDRLGYGASDLTARTVTPSAWSPMPISTGKSFRSSLPLAIKEWRRPPSSTSGSSATRGEARWSSSRPVSTETSTS